MSGRQPNNQEFMCSALVRLRLLDAGRRKRCRRAVLEGISAAAASLLTERPIAEGSELDLLCGKCWLRGKVRECRFYPHLGYGVTMDFHDESRWSADLYRPAHMTSPSEVKGCRCKGTAACKMHAACRPPPQLSMEERLRTAGSESAIVSPGMTERELRRCFACLFGLPRRSTLFPVYAGSYRETERAIGDSGDHEDAAVVLARLARVLKAECGACRPSPAEPGRGIHPAPPARTGGRTRRPGAERVG